VSMRAVNWNVRRRAALAAILLTSSIAAMPAASASDTHGTITALFQAGSLIYVYATKVNANDSCTTGRNYIVTHLDPATPIGKAQLAMALTASQTGASVYMGGAGNCTTSGTPNGVFSETMVTLLLNSQ
jgi:hypothetical protein